MSTVSQCPSRFLEIRVQDLSTIPELTAACAGYEGGKWRCKQLAEHLLDWLPEFALRRSELADVRWHNARRRLKQAANTVYKSKRYRNRGEVGELLLHILIRQSFSTVPVISKYFYKDSPNDTVKGFDAVHVVVDKNSLELWLGEVKLYKNARRAIRAAIKELRKHLRRDYLRMEFAAITNKIDDSWNQSQRLKNLLDPNASMDKVFTRICVPILIAYDSNAISKHKAECSAFLADFESEVKKLHKAFSTGGPPRFVRIHLFLLPLCKKTQLLKDFHEELERLQ